MGSALRMRTAVPVALLGGLVLWLAFPPVGLGWLAPVGVALITAAQLRTTMGRGALLGLISGLALFLPLLSWLHVVGTDAAIALAFVMSLWFMLQGAMTSLVTRLPGWPVWVASLWVAQEWLRGLVPWGGFPWGRLAFAQAETSIGRLAAVIGLSGVTFAVALIGTALLAVGVALRGEHRRPAVGWALVALVIVLGPAWLTVTPPPAGHAVVALVQGGTPQTGMGAMDVRRAVLDNHVRETMTLSRQVSAGRVPRPAFVLWPENSTDLDPLALPEAAGLIDMAAQAIDRPILVGAIVLPSGRDDGVFNVGIVWDPSTGPGQMYAKRHPVPFGEFIPMRSLIAKFVGRFDRIPRDFIPGTEAGLLDVGGVRVGDLICFEVAYDDVVQPLLHAGAPMLTVQTNNATYTGTAQPDQQLEITRMRAIESGRTIAVAATSGISAFIGPDGQVQQSLESGRSGSLVSEVPLVQDRTPAATMGPRVNALLVLIALVAIGFGAVSAVRRRRAAGPKVDA